MDNRCTILLFAHAADVVGQRELSIDLPAGATVAETLDTLCALYPGLSAIKSSLAIAVNEKYARMDDFIPDGAAIAIIPPVSGG